MHDPLPGPSDPASLESWGGISPFTCVLPGFVIVVAIAVASGLLLLRCITRSDATTYSASIDTLSMDAPVYLSGPGIYLVREADTVIALDHFDERAGEGGLCIIRYRPPAQRDDPRAAYRGDCTTARFDRTGARIDPPGAPMKRHPVTQNGGRFTVQYAPCVLPGQEQPISCKP